MEGYRYYLDVGKVKECIKIFNDNHPSLYRSKLPTLLKWERDCVNLTINRNRWVKSNKKSRKKGGRTS